MTEERSSSRKEKFKQTLCLSCCFTTRRAPLDSPNDKPKPSLIKTSSNWIKTRAHEVPEMKDVCAGLFARIGKHHCRRHSAAADFRYDPLSYSLNFEDGVEASRIDEAPLKDFCSRLPPSRPLKPASVKQTPLERV